MTDCNQWCLHCRYYLYLFSHRSKTNFHSFDCCSMKALRNEREFLARRMGSRLNDEERERLFIKWQVPLDTKQRKLQLVSKLWTDPNDRAHIEESADLVARLVGFCEGGNVSKEMFELNFAVPTSRKPWLVGWQPISNMIREKTQLW